MTERAMFQVHLLGKGYSGRGVRYRVLTASEIEHNERVAGESITKEATVASYNVEVMRFGLDRMLLEVTDPNVEPKNLPTARWHKVSPDTIRAQWDTFFTSKDTSALKRIYRAEHSVTEEEIEAILSGKAEVLAE